MAFLTAGMNRPGFTGEFFVQNLCDVIKGVHAFIEVVLHFLAGQSLLA
jgi:hypothetical protein